MEVLFQLVVEEVDENEGVCHKNTGDEGVWEVVDRHGMVVKVELFVDI